MTRHYSTQQLAKKKAQFLGVLQTVADVTRSAEKVGVPRRTLYDWRKADQEFAAAWVEAVDLGTDALEDEAIRRAKEGTLRPVYQGGKHVGDVREYSDTLLIFMLKARRPERFRDNSRVEVAGDKANPLHVNSIEDRIDELTKSGAFKRVAERVCGHSGTNGVADP